MRWRVEGTESKNGAFAGKDERRERLGIQPRWHSWSRDQWPHQPSQLRIYELASALLLYLKPLVQVQVQAGRSWIFVGHLGDVNPSTFTPTLPISVYSLLRYQIRFDLI
ncbi:hypothetical protein V6N13_108472 [Hibiscus sabdariffa]|uniref:Uncharacterized protein n=1 Tax=Hibiscus sabdariffa TaxID=183260 RepID=A0ABR2ST18_9ROSI